MYVCVKSALTCWTSLPWQERGREKETENYQSILSKICMQFIAAFMALFEGICMQFIAEF